MHDWMFSTWAGARQAYIEVESRQTPQKNGLLGWGEHALLAIQPEAKHVKLEKERVPVTNHLLPGAG